VKGGKFKMHVVPSSSRREGAEAETGIGDERDKGCLPTKVTIGSHLD
jgi:hypothetical protein